ncbi:syntaphilin [Pungitius pungitius]|uniref:syntaphilin n=1 Tax=Pungitius pungitius TaxID=134920 RepID=UPI002E14BFFF
MSLAPSRKPSSEQRRRSVGTGGSGVRCVHSDASSTHTYPGRVKAAEGSPTARTYPVTPRRQAKHTGCSDNHGIRPPTPEQYLTPLQQKEVCIRHLRARLRDNVERLQHRDCEIDGLRTQLYRMQEDWVEEECHRVEAQMALKEARKEIQHLQEVVDTAKSNLSAREQTPHDHKPCPGGLQGARQAGRSRSCGCSPAGTLSRGTTRTRLSSEALHLEHGPNAPEPSRAPRPAGQSHLLLDASLLSEQLPARGPPTLPRSSTYERLVSGGGVLPVSHSCHTLGGGSGCKCSGHSCLPHHHLFLHLPQEAPPAPGPVPTPTPAAERKPEVRSRACSPTMTWLCEESGAEGLSTISSDAAPSEPHLFPSSLPAASPPGAAGTPAEPRTCQPPATAALPERRDAVVVEVDEDGTEGPNEDGYPPQLCHWSRYFLVDLLALAMPVVPTVAWLCRGASREVVPVYQIGSLLRGCCAVALHSLRRRGASGGRGPPSTSGTTPI